MADDEKVPLPVKYWKIQADGLDIGFWAESSGGKMSVQATQFKQWDGQGKPLPLPVAVQPSFGDITLTRGIDKEGACYEWISQNGQKGPSVAKKEVTLIGCDADGNPVQSIKLTDAHPVNYESKGHSASGTDVLTESITLQFTDMQINEKGGLTGPVG
jgi:phage tail-like protein